VASRLRPGDKGLWVGDKPNASSPYSAMPGYETKQESIVIPGAANLVIRSLLNGQQFSDPHGEAARLGISSATWPLFGLLWPSGALLAGRMAAHVLRPGERILEIGCGLALSSLVAHRRGADVTASDCHPLAALFLQHNLRLNDLPAMHYQHGEWADTTTITSTSTTSPNDLRGARWTGAVHSRYDLIIGSDVLYDRDASAALAGFITRHAAPAAQVWIMDPNRGNRPAFSALLRQAGFVLHDEHVAHLAVGDVAAYKGHMLTYSRAG
jgi:predicted nicotinamide N-methyase